MGPQGSPFAALLALVSLGEVFVGSLTAVLLLAIALTVARRADGRGALLLALGAVLRLSLFGCAAVTEALFLSERFGVLQALGSLPGLLSLLLLLASWGAILAGLAVLASRALARRARP